MSRILIDEKRCKACGLCETVCPLGLIETDKSKIEVNGLGCAAQTGEGCTGCAACAIICPDIAIKVERC